MPGLFCPRQIKESLFKGCSGCLRDLGLLFAPQYRSILDGRVDEVAEVALEPVREPGAIIVITDADTIIATDLSDLHHRGVVADLLVVVLKPRDPGHGAEFLAILGQAQCIVF